MPSISMPGRAHQRRRKRRDAESLFAGVSYSRRHRNGTHRPHRALVPITGRYVPTLFSPGWLIAMTIFPGVAGARNCAPLLLRSHGNSGVQICYFQRRNPAGYVVHGSPRSLQASFSISIGPLIVNTLPCFLLTFSAMIPVQVLKARNVNLIFYALLWVGFSIGMNAFPSNQDMANFLMLIRASPEKRVWCIVRHRLSACW